MHCTASQPGFHPLFLVHCSQRKDEHARASHSAQHDMNGMISLVWVPTSLIGCVRFHSVAAPNHPSGSCPCNCSVHMSAPSGYEWDDKPGLGFHQRGGDVKGSLCGPSTSSFTCFVASVLPQDCVAILDHAPSQPLEFHFVHSAIGILP